MSPHRRSKSTSLDPDKCVEMAQTCACFNFRKASRTVTQLFDQILAPLGVRSTQLVILVATQVYGPIGLAKLAHAMVMDRSTITRNLQPLVSLGYLKLSGKSGRAGKTVEITPAGQELLVKALPYWEQAQSTLLARMGQDRWDRVMSDLTNIVDATRGK
jgi:DNA-binding MarR family transcriptional regulator